MQNRGKFGTLLRLMSLLAWGWGIFFCVPDQTGFDSPNKMVPASFYIRRKNFWNTLFLTREDRIFTTEVYTSNA